MSRLPIENFTLPDATTLAELSASVGWHDTFTDWHTVLSTGDVVGLREGATPIAVAARFDFGAVWSIGKVVVHPKHRGRGHARRILEHLLDAERARDTHVTLVATAQGEPVYRRLGFRPVGTVHKLIGPAACEPSSGHEVLDEGRLDAALALDRAVFGADRSRLLSRRVLGSTRAVARVTDRELTGYGVAIAQGGNEVIGPVVAATDRDALGIVRALLTREARTRRIDVPSKHARLIGRLVALGFKLVDVPPVMSLGGGCPPGDASRRFALAAQAFG